MEALSNQWFGPLRSATMKLGASVIGFTLGGVNPSFALEHL
jgi:hypothetical protein